MADEFKKFYAEYKKCSTITKKDVKEVELNSDSARHFRFDMFKFLEQLEDVVLEEKASADPIKASKIEDYCKENKTIRELYKAADYNRGKAVEHAAKLSDLPKTAEIKTAQSNLINLKKDVEKDLKSRDKKDKQRADIEKLEKEIDADLKIMADCAQAVAKSPGGFKANMEFTKAIQKIMDAKPRLSDKTKKFIILGPKMLTKDILNQAKKKLEDLESKLKKEAEQIIASSDSTDAKKTKEKIEAAQQFTKHFQKLQAIVKSYTDIKKNYVKQINDIKDANEKNLILKSIKEFKLIGEAAERLEKEAKA